MENREPALARESHILVGSLGFAFDAENSIATLEKTAGDRVEELTSDFVTERLRAGLLDDGEGYPFADHGDVAGLIDRESMRFESFQVSGDEMGIVICAGAIRS